MFNMNAGNKYSEYHLIASCGMNDMKAARPFTTARLTEEGPMCSWRANYHIEFNTFTLSRTDVLCHDYCQVHQLRLHWEIAEIFPNFRL